MIGVEIQVIRRMALTIIVLPTPGPPVCCPAGARRGRPRRANHAIFAVRKSKMAKGVYGRVSETEATLTHSRRKKGSRNPKAECTNPIVGGVAAADRQAQVGRHGVPGTTMDIAATAIATVDPRRAVRGRAVVIAVHAILSPLEEVPHHVIETKGVRWKRANWRRLLIIPFAAALLAVGQGLSVELDVIAPRVNRTRAGARSIFVFSLRQQPIGLAGHPREPSDIRLRVFPVHIDYRLLPTPPVLIGGLVSVAAAARDAGIPFGKGQLIFLIRRTSSQMSPCVAVFQTHIPVLCYLLLPW